MNVRDCPHHRGPTCPRDQCVSQRLEQQYFANRATNPKRKTRAELEKLCHVLEAEPDQWVYNYRAKAHCGAKLLFRVLVFGNKAIYWPEDPPLDWSTCNHTRVKFEPRPKIPKSAIASLVGSRTPEHLVRLTDSIDLRAAYVTKCSRCGELCAGERMQTSRVCGTCKLK